MKNQSKYYIVLDVPILQIPGATTPVLIINGQVSVFSMSYARELQQTHGRSNSTIRKKLSSIGRLWDYYLSTSSHVHNETFLNSFCEARIHGTIQPDGSDKTKLYWTSPSYKTAIRDFNAVSDYMEFVSNHFGTIPMNPQERAYQGTIEYARNLERKKKYSLLYFASQKIEFVKTRKSKRKDRHGKSNNKTIYKFFPPHKIPDLLTVMTTPRDKMIIILLAFGGIRISELLHLYISDVQLNKDGTAKISLYNPVEGKHTWIGLNNKKHIGTRRTYLSEMYGMLPRNLLSSNDGLYVGWKGIQEADSHMHVSNVEWTVKEMGILFYKLHKKYLNERAACKDTHPYYFISQHGKTSGQPLRYSSLINHLRNKFKAVGLDLADNNVKPHALRHYYGYFAANVMGLSSEVVQVMMRHGSLSSTEVYYQLTNETVRDAIKQGYKKIDEQAKKELLLCGH